jgi:single-stranded-DNA-specific exonuclease
MALNYGTHTVELPETRIHMRKRNEKRFELMHNAGYSELVSILTANRAGGISTQALFKPSLSGLDVTRLKDVDKSSERIGRAVANNETIALCVDFDVDGISSGVVMHQALTKYIGVPEDKVKIYVNNRLGIGYGFNTDALSAILKDDVKNPPTLLITADQGSNDNATVKEYHAFMTSKGIEGADVIVTDHHHIDEKTQASDAYAFVNPQRPDCEFEDKTICGCVVALFVMVAARKYMVDKGIVPKSTPRLTPLLTYASMATVADCVSLKSNYNRCIIKSGLRDLNLGSLPAWEVIKKASKGKVTTDVVGFTVAPRFNADSRTGGDGMTAVRFFLAKTFDEAQMYWDMLGVRNDTRKDEERKMLEDAMIEASRQYYEDEKRGLVIYLPKGNHGVHGIVASRIKDQFNTPTIIFSPVDLDEKECPNKRLTCSARSVEPLDILESAERIKHEDDFGFTCGGHPAALGGKLLKKHLKKFSVKFDEYVKEQAKDRGLVDNFFNPYVEIDHLIQGNELSWLRDDSVITEIDKLVPYGQKFPAPVFGVNGKIDWLKERGDMNQHLSIRFVDSRGSAHYAIMFNYTRNSAYGKLRIGQDYTFAVSLSFDDFRGEGVSILIQAVSQGMNSIYR